MLTFLILAHMADPSGGIADPSGGILTFLAVPYAIYVNPVNPAWKNEWILFRSPAQSSWELHTWIFIWQTGSMKLT